MDEARMLLAVMCYYAPSYGSTVEPFARAHQAACRLLANEQSAITPGEMQTYAMDLPSLEGDTHYLRQAGLDL